MIMTEADDTVSEHEGETHPQLGLFKQAFLWVTLS